MTKTQSFFRKFSETSRLHKAPPPESGHRKGGLGSHIPPLLVIAKSFAFARIVSEPAQ